MVLVLFTTFYVQAEPIKNECINAELMKKDAEELYKKLKRAHYDLFVNIPQKRMDQYYVDLIESISGCLDKDMFSIILQKFVSKGQVAHARIELPRHLYIEYQDNQGTFFPLGVKSDGRKLWVIQNFSGNSDIKVGDEIISINGAPTITVLNQLRSYLSADTDRMFGGFMEFYFAMLMWFEYGTVTNYVLEINDNGTIKKHKANAITIEQRNNRAKKEEKVLQLDWQRVSEMKNGHIGYLRSGPFFNTVSNAEDMWDNTAFKKFIDQAFQSFTEQKAQAILIDLRDNPGGDNSFSDLMMQWIADKPFKFASTFNVKVSDEFKASNESRLATSKAHQKNKDNTSAQYKKAYDKKQAGIYFEHKLPTNNPGNKRVNIPVFMLINRHSYSNAVFVAAMAQDYHFATILGEETSDLATTYGAMEHFNLTNSGIIVGFPKAFIVRPNGDQTIRGVVPDYIIETPLIESENDPVLNEAINFIEREVKNN